MAVTRAFPVTQLRTAQQRAAAAVVWLRACRASGEAAEGAWGQDRRASTDAVVTDGLSLDEPHRLLACDEYWWVESPSWSDKYLGMTAAPGVVGESGSTAWSDLKKPTPGVALRLVRIGEGDAAETFAVRRDADAVHLFDPKVGLWRADLADAEQWFRGYMERNYAKVSALRFRAYLVRSPIPVHYTWIGPPSTKVKTVDGVTVQADIGGPSLLSGVALAPGATPLDIRFHCLRTHVPAFRQRLAPAIKVLAIEDEWPNPPGAPLVLHQPDLGNPALTTQYIVSTSIALQAAAAPGATKRDAVNAKNAWSMYCLWRHGGYQLDTGVIPIVGAHPSLPEPTDFGLAYLAKESPLLSLHDPVAGADLRRARLQTVLGPLNALLQDDTTNAYRGMVYPPGTPAVVREQLVRIPGGHVDVWMMRAPRGHAMIRRALEFYAVQWFHINAMRAQLTAITGLYEAAYRAAVVSAVLTGMAPTADKAFWGADTQFLLPHLMRVKGERAEELGLQKVGFQSHLVAAVVD